MKRFRFRFETLEDRRLMAADCTADCAADPRTGGGASGDAGASVEVAAGVPQAPRGLNAVDAFGAPVAIEHNANTIVLAVATWCPHCQQLEAELSLPEYREALAGLRIVFVFGDEGGSGPGGVRDAEALEGLPGEVAFLGAGSAVPPAFPTVYDPATGQFGGDPREAIAAWHQQQAAPEEPEASAPGAAPAATPAAPPGTTPGTGVTFASADTNAAGEPVAAPLRALTLPAHGGGGLGGVGFAAACSLVGDYNADALVDAADYTVWRDTLTSTIDLRADGDGNLVVDQADYDLWLAHYGAACPALPGAFDILGPIGVQSQRENTISWSESAGATGYRFVLSQQPDATFPLYDEVVQGTSRSLSLNNGTYYAAVFAQNAAGETLATSGIFQIVVQLPPAEQLLFVSGVRFSVSATPTFPPFAGSFGSARAADYQCNRIAFDAGILPDWDFETLHFRALLTEGSANIQIRSNMREGIYFNTSGNVIANNVTDVLAGVRLAPVLTQNATALTGPQAVWTGANGDGTAGTKCTNWSTTTGTAQVGNLNGTGTNWLFQGTIGCTGFQRLYCAGDRPDPPAPRAAAIDAALAIAPHEPEASAPGAIPVPAALRGLTPAAQAERARLGRAVPRAALAAGPRDDSLLVAAAAVDAALESTAQPESSARRRVEPAGPGADPTAAHTPRSAGVARWGWAWDFEHRVGGR